MRKITIGITVGLVCALVSYFSFAEEITRQRLEELNQECQSEREQNIAPLREQAIEDCINKERKKQNYCKRYYRNLGEGPAGGSPPGLFWWLPVCEKAFNAEKYFKMNPGKEVYSLP
jgi:hypothetical protein